VPVSKTFRAFAPDQMLLLPPSLDEWLPEDHLARFVAELVDEVLDLGPILASYTEKRGFPPYDPPADGAAADLRIHHRGALVSGDRG
jgi:transposase